MGEIQAGQGVWAPTERKGVLIGALFYKDDWEMVSQLVPSKQVGARRRSS